MPAAPITKLTLDEFAILMRERFPVSKPFLESDVVKAKIPGLARTAIGKYIMRLHEHGGLSHIDVPGRHYPCYVLNEPPVACAYCAAKQKRDAEREAQEREDHLLPEEVARDLKDINRIAAKVKGTRLGNQIEAAFSEIRTLAEVARRFK